MIPEQLPDSLHILAGLRHLDAAGFVRVFQARRLNPRGVNSLLDLAEALGEPEQVHKSLAQLNWPLLRGLRAGDASAIAAASDYHFTRTDATPPRLLDSVAAGLETLVPRIPDFSAALPHDARSGAEAAHFIGTIAVDALEQLDLAPRTVRGGRGGIRMSGVEVRRIAADLGIDPAVAASLYRWLFSAGLMAPLDGAWLPTATGRELAQQPVIDRWRILAHTWLQELTPSALAELCEGVGMASPIIAAVKEDLTDAPTTSAIQLPGELTARRLSTAALGVIHLDPEAAIDELTEPHDQLTRVGALVLDDNLDAAADLLTAEFPREVDRVYLQPDRTIIAPGPLQPAVEAQLRTVADLARRAIASEYRITEQSIYRALQSGMSAEDIRSVLSSTSLTGVPQPIDYLVGDLAARYGQVRVRALGPVGHHGGSLVRALTPELGDQLRVDAALRQLGLRPVTEGLITSLPAPAVLNTLLEARYPAILEDAEGAPVDGATRPVAIPYVAEVTASLRATAETLAELAAANPETNDQDTWLRRRLELAHRDRRALDVTIDDGTGSTRTLLLMPISVNPQRLRALDIDADVERTLPLRSIISIDDD